MSNFTVGIDDLVANFNSRGGLARSNFFAVTFVGPEGVVADPILVSSLCESASLPGISVSTGEGGKTTQSIKYPYSWINDDVTLTFYVTNDFYIKNLWDTWIRRVVDTKNGKIGYKKYFKSDVVISVLNLDHNEVYQCTLEDAYPIGIDAIPLSNTEENGLMRLSVTLTYTNFTTKSKSFEYVSSTYEFNSSLGIPNPLLPGLTFNPFNDIQNQINFSLQTAKDTLRSNLENAKMGIINNLKSRYQDTITTITRPFDTALKSINTQINTSLSQIVDEINAPINKISDAINETISDIISTPIDAITGVINSGITAVTGGITKAIKGFFGGFGF